MKNARIRLDSELDRASRVELRINLLKFCVVGSMAERKSIPGECLITVAERKTGCADLP
jgi:hypothetical protein